jgi:hypothetical protein
MKGKNSIFVSLVFILTVIILLVRPVVFLRSQSLHPASRVTKAYAIKQSLKKTRERLRINNIINNTVPEISLGNGLVSFYIFAHNKRVELTLLLLSLLLSFFSFFKRKGRSLFEIYPDNHRYLAISVIRI